MANNASQILKLCATRQSHQHHLDSGARRSLSHRRQVQQYALKVPLVTRDGCMPPTRHSDQTIESFNASCDEAAPWNWRRQRAGTGSFCAATKPYNCSTKGPTSRTVTITTAEADEGCSLQARTNPKTVSSAAKSRRGQPSESRMI